MNNPILIGDIGGTKTTLAIFSARDGFQTTAAAESFASADYPDLSSIIEIFLKNMPQRPDKASFGVAGPVLNGQAVITNLPWKISEHTLQKQHQFLRVTLINDLQAIASAIPLLSPEDSLVIHPGTPDPFGTIAVIAPGTGLGEAFLVRNGKDSLPFASEGGHADFAPSTERQITLLRYLKKQYSHVSYERVCSGQGIIHLYRFLCEEAGRHCSPEIEMLVDPTPHIIKAALDKSCPLCQSALELFTEILGSETGNLGLKLLSTGGIFLAGGIPPRIMTILDSDTFRRHYEEKGRLSHVIKRIPVRVIMNPMVPLVGAAAYALKQGSMPDAAHIL